MSFKDATIDSRGNSYPWHCEGCQPRNDKHEPDCPYSDKTLMTLGEDPRNNDYVRPAYCKKCGCTYSNGCSEHSASDQQKLVKR